MRSNILLLSAMCGACSGAHLPAPPAPASTPSSSASAHHPWTCSTPVGALSLPIPEAHGLPLVGVSVVVQVGPQRITVACDAPTVVEAPPSAAPTAAPDAAPAPESAP